MIALLTLSQSEEAALPWIPVLQGLLESFATSNDIQKYDLFQNHKQLYKDHVFGMYKSLLEAKLYSRTDIFSITDFKGLSTVATLPGHQSNKTYCMALG